MCVCLGDGVAVAILEAQCAAPQLERNLPAFVEYTLNFLNGKSLPENHAFYLSYHFFDSVTVLNLHSPCFYSVAHLPAAIATDPIVTVLLLQYERYTKRTIKNARTHTLQYPR